MYRNERPHPAWIVLALLVALVTLGALSACGDGDSESPKGTTAKGGLSAARSALSTSAPDAKLLVVQTAASVTPTGTPVWAYLFGSPSTDKTFVVYVENGEAVQATEYGTAGLSESEWSKVPGTDEWKIDSDAAYGKAIEASGADGDPAGYAMGMQTYVPEAMAEGNTSEPMIWYVFFDPGESGATTGTVQVDARTGSTKAE